MWRWLYAAMGQVNSPLRRRVVPPTGLGSYYPFHGQEDQRSRGLFPPSVLREVSPVQSREARRRQDGFPLLASEAVPRKPEVGGIEVDPMNSAKHRRKAVV